MREIDQLHNLLVIVEGPDGAGKTTFVDNLRKKCGYQVYIFDRFGPGSCFVFDELFRRPVEVRRNYVAELQRLDRVFELRQVILFAPPAMLRERITSRDRQPDKGEESVNILKEQVQLFGAWAALSKRFVPTLQLWTEHRDQATSAQEAFDWLMSTVERRPSVETPSVWDLLGVEFRKEPAA